MKWFGIRYFYQHTASNIACETKRKEIVASISSNRRWMSVRLSTLNQSDILHRFNVAKSTSSQSSKPSMILDFAVWIMHNLSRCWKHLWNLSSLEPLLTNNLWPLFHFHINSHFKWHFFWEQWVDFNPIFPELFPDKGKLNSFKDSFLHNGQTDFRMYDNVENIFLAGWCIQRLS